MVAGHNDLGPVRGTSSLPLMVAPGIMRGSEGVPLMVAGIMRGSEGVHFSLYLAGIMRGSEGVHFP